VAGFFPRIPELLKRIDMKNWSIFLMLLLGSLFLFQACDDDDESNFTMDRQTFVTQASSSNMLEIQAGQQAQQKGASVAVRAYGEMMVTDHTATGTELANLASQKGLTVSAQLLPPHQQQLAVLTPLTGDLFDRAFADLMVASHQEAVTLFDQASQQVNDQDLRSWAAGKLPALQAHLQGAQTLKSNVNP
jgi:putative membrane protein